MKSLLTWVAVLTLVVASLGLPAATATAAPNLFRLFNTGCRVTASPAHGCLVGSVMGPGSSGRLAQGSREGRACGWNLLALISVGDVRVTTAMRNGGISEVSAIDHYSFELVPGFYGFSRYCTVVHGE